ncbi:hypothetical protein DFR86_02265 [Acidianus sulfidivorans JP7]|uniref:Uncharacterized protein n=1 Tax=Acidianus sulfidivorans JP7 TaxID=619593 RepID=A0A2U9IKD1_9CREN|nr:hypothetical protein [Acidianus sulfidivorans]AWR96491.1 hypothetical protein DFR86_02265 [Acidianus sulfidivorans JP7]
MVSLYKALQEIGFVKVNARTLQRGNTIFKVSINGDEARYYIHTQFGSATYYSQKAALHGLVLRFAISREDLEKLRDLGLDIAKIELENYERTMKRVEKEGRKAIMDYIEKLDR